MIYGIIGAEGDEAILSPSVFSDAVGVANFALDQFLWNGVTITSADVVDAPTGRIDTNGLHIPADDAGGVIPIIGDFLTKLLTANWGMVLELNWVSGDAGTSFVIEQYPSDAQYIYMDHATATNWGLHEQASGGGGSRNVALSISDMDTGTHKFAISIADGIFAISKDGGAVQSSGTVIDSANMNALTNAGFGGWHGFSSDSGEFYVKAITLYNSISIDQLPVLSA